MNSEPAKPLQPFVADEKILVTQPFLPPLEEAQEFLQDIWDSKCTYLGQTPKRRQ